MLEGVKGKLTKATALAIMGGHLENGHFGQFGFGRSSVEELKSSVKHLVMCCVI